MTQYLPHRLLRGLLLAPASFLALATAQAQTAAPARPAAPAAAQGQAAARPQAPMQIIRYEAVSPLSPQGDKLATARRVAAAILAQGKPNPQMIVDVGSYTGEFLEAFLEQFPAARGQWTEPVENNRVNAHRRLDRFGNRVDYVIGCAARDISLGCVPAGVDVLISSWLTIHQNLEGIRKFHRDAMARLPSGGWIAIIDHVSAGEVWDKRLADARKDAAAKGLVGQAEGPPVHHPDYKTPTLEEQLDAMRAAGFVEIKVVWRQLDTILVMGRKP